MKLETTIKTNHNRAGERGAALVTMLLASILILGAGGALIMSTMMSANNSIELDSRDAGLLRGRVGNAVGAERAPRK